MAHTDTETTVRREVAIDTALADIYRKASALHGQRAALDSRFRHYAGAKKLGRYQWDKTAAECREIVRTKLAAGWPVSWEVRNVTEALTGWDQSDADLTALATEREPLDAEYRSAPWNRFFLVPGGHIHSSQGCFTLRPTTQIGWLPQLSGLTEADAVAAHGTVLCSHCFPSAPVEWTVGKVTKKAADKIEADRVEAERKALADAPVGADGEHVKLAGTVVRCNVSPGQYGMKTMFEMKTNAGQNVVWFASLALDFSRGQRVHLDAIVKRHESYRGERRTIVTHGKVVSA